MDMRIFEISEDVHALVEELLPGMFPGGRFDAPLARVVLPVGQYARTASTWRLLERCAPEPRERWPRLVEDWLQDVGDKAVLSIADMELLGGDVRERLRLLVVPTLSDSELKVLMAIRAGPYFSGVVVIDHPEYGGPLTRHRAALLGLRRLGHVVTRTQEEVADAEVRDQPLTLREQVRVVTKPGSRYIPILFTEIQRFVPEAGDEGALFSVPTHSTMLLHTIGDGAALEAFTEVTRELHGASDDPCSASVFRWRRGRPTERLTH